MKLSLLTSSRLVSPVSLCPLSSKRVFYRYFLRGFSINKRSNDVNPNRSLHVRLGFEPQGSIKGDYETDGDNSVGKSEFVEVISIGSKKDAIIDFCLDSPFQLSSSLRFWIIQWKGSSDVQLQERCIEKDRNLRIVEASEFLQLCPKAFVLVASAGYGLDDTKTIDILKAIRAAHGFAVSILLMPFSFEGQRRKDEVAELKEKIQEHTNLCICIDTDTLLKKDLVTLDEALKTANSAVLMAINAISVLVSEIEWKRSDVSQKGVEELKAAEIMQILKDYKEAKIGFGAGNNVKSSISHALYDCPFIGAGVEDLNGIVICIIASSNFVSSEEIYASFHIFSQTVDCKREIIMSTVIEPNLEPDMVIATIVILGCTERQAPQRSSIFSRLAQRFPFVFKLLGRDSEQLNSNKQNEVTGATNSDVINSPESGALEYGTAVESVTGGVEKHSQEFAMETTNGFIDIYSSRFEESDMDLLEDGAQSSNFYDEISEGTPAFQREPRISWNLGPGYQVAQEWANERTGDTSILDNVSIFRLPVGVKSSEDLKDGANMPYAKKFPESKEEDDVKKGKVVNSSRSSWGGFYNNASTASKGRNVGIAKKQGGLSVRAASMLEAERDLPKKWSPITEMQYRGGVYKGRCQGGLPEGKGCLKLEDGSIYDGLWRYGKRSGPGTFYFSNGDVFQGLWRDDAMHGKGWFYFHTGDRWFSNFWKGKANGESRFYSKSGDVYFGQFEDGWRHGPFLCIDVHGVRCVETWDRGILVSRKLLDSDA